ncbi:hypothetical protein APA73_28270 [Pseudomonas aeruginosa]|uniref:hypothetical protein n=1 Tax=Pseudomonas aeruginosa TaxID=287 RepID=UPI00071B080E|nr:hypothetical protein [Pseudomonas aeruginosa]HCF8148305.1 hypothetical protein [Klebsiella pneumoniae]KSL62097.1 hypothetical protein APA58_28105 [Pseudomonas aeruginosa]KSM76448.1 hypothetical protein APA73_28270 [Pseudomonas aeruginosa]MDI2556701.1 hypothetical protein [Pseudomonas aeruginosa]UVH93520.1 hypothetical protein NW341_06200 [Pseudomonas aeruginosa]
MSKFIVIILCIASAGVGALGTHVLASTDQSCAPQAAGPISDAEKDFWSRPSTRGGAKGY